MARSKEQILESINATANSLPALTDLQANTSLTSTWVEFKNVLANVLHEFEREQDNLLIAFNEAATRRAVGTVDWYRDQILKYSIGQVPVIEDNKIILKGSGSGLVDKVAIEETPETTGDAADLIVDPGSTFSGVAPNLYRVPLLEIAQDTNIDAGQIQRKKNEITIYALKAGNERLLSSDRTLLRNYLNEIKILGTKINIISAIPQPIHLQLRVLVNRTVSRVDAKEMEIQTKLTEAFNEIQFNGVLTPQHIIDAVKEVDNVLSVRLLKAQCVEIDLAAETTTVHNIFFSDTTEEDIDNIESPLSFYNQHRSPSGHFEFKTEDTGTDGRTVIEVTRASYTTLIS